MQSLENDQSTCHIRVAPCASHLYAHLQSEGGEAEDEGGDVVHDQRYKHAEIGVAGRHDDQVGWQGGGGVWW